MTKEKPIGYKKKSLKFLIENNVNAWNEIEITKGDAIFKGILLPRPEFEKDGYIEIKLKNGYNIGIEITENTKIQILSEKPKMELSFDGKKIKKDKSKPNISLLGTGGTIASRLDYATGGVIPAFEPHELFAAVPELIDIANIETEDVFQISSEDMTPKDWLVLAEKITEKSNSGVDGIVVTHGTDTMSYSTAVMSFLIQNLKVPVVFVGSQRSSDRPSSDAALNLINAVTLASKGDIAEVVQCMLGSSSHKYGLFHRGTLVRKMHSSARHAFRTIGDIPLGKVENGEISYFKNKYRTKSEAKNNIETTCYKKIEDKVGLVWIYPGISSDLIDFYIDNGYKGLVIAGTGLGHTSRFLFDSLKRACDKGIMVMMTVQTLWGYTGMNVYEGGRKLIECGVIPGKNILPGTAFAKMCVVLGNYSDPEEAKKIMLSNIAGEYTAGEPKNGYQIFQGIE
ncbi:MAG: Glu-tRNA(Gln) amidotransferase subunit GatD [archaeon]|nr:Glu-tRNA(Gln) amidotransferase subunit GatD [archaeon]